jgi:hypothetical protein
MLAIGLKYAEAVVLLSPGLDYRDVTQRKYRAKVCEAILGVLAKKR